MDRPTGLTVAATHGSSVPGAAQALAMPPAGAPDDALEPAAPQAPGVRTSPQATNRKGNDRKDRIAR